MAECEANYLDAMSPSVTDVMATMTQVDCVAADGWWVGGSTAAAPSDVSFCVSDGEWVVQKDGNTYPTCVAYGEPQTVCSNSDLVCPNDPSSSNPMNFGWPGNYNDRLQEAFTRNDYKHPDCPSVECEPLNDWWKNWFMDNDDVEVTQNMADNVCVTPDQTIWYVDRDAMYNTCVGFSTTWDEPCNSGQYLCSGHDGAGLFVYGWPGQITKTLARALENENFIHPQCPLQVC